METETLVYLKKRLKSFYWDNQVPSPKQVYKREFGFGTLEDKIKFRHKAFKTDRELAQFLKTEAPYYISYSAAYYEFPNQPMRDKSWLGADLIFDLDKPMEYLDSVLLMDVRDEAQAIIDFLLDDFGMDKDEIGVNFSGSKGYHIHAFSDDVLTLDSVARRQIIGYISGEGLDIELLFAKTEGQSGIQYRHGRAVGISENWVGPSSASTGWAKRVYDQTQNLLTLSEKDLMKIEGIGPKTAKKLFENREKNLKLLEQGKWTAFWNQVGSAVEKKIKKLAIKVTDDDKQVTGDISRLIRLPETIHGGSGLIAKKVRSLDSFDPLVDAVAFGDEPVEVKLIADAKRFDLSGNAWGPYHAGEKIKVPESVAVYLMLKGRCDLA